LIFVGRGLEIPTGSLMANHIWMIRNLCLICENLWQIKWFMA